MRMNTDIKTIFEIISHYTNSPVWRSCIIDAEFNLLRERLNDDTLYIAVIGSSSGKSSLINSIIGYDILPIGIISGTTRFPCIIRRSESDDIHIVYENEASRKFSNNSLYLMKRYCIEKASKYPVREILCNLSSDDNGIKYAEVSLSDINLPEDIALVDTPCICSEDEYDEATLFAASTLSDSLALAINYDKPLPGDIVDFINENGMTSRMNDSVFIITKADLFRNPDNEIPVQISHIQHRASSVFGVKNPLVIAVPSVHDTPDMKRMSTENTAIMFEFIRKRREKLKTSYIPRICSCIREELIRTLKIYELSEPLNVSVPASHEFKDRAEGKVKDFCGHLTNGIDNRVLPVLSLIDEAENNITAVISRSENKLSLRKYILSLSVDSFLSDIYSRADDLINSVVKLANEKAQEISDHYHNVYSLQGVKGIMEKITLTDKAVLMHTLESECGNEFRDNLASVIEELRREIFVVFSRNGTLTGNLDYHKTKASDELSKLFISFRDKMQKFICRLLGNVIRILEVKINSCISMMLDSDREILSETDNENKRRFWVDPYVKKDIQNCISELAKVIEH